MAFGAIFDMDGVLVLTEDAHWRSWQTVAAPLGVTITHEVFLSCFGRINPDCIRIMFGEQVEEAEARRIADEKETAFREIVRQRVPLTPGLIPVLEALRAAGGKLAVGSSAPPENVDLVLDSGEIRGYFAAVADGSQVKRGKPAPDVFLLAAEKLRMEPRECTVIEDAPAGIRAANAAGMRAIGLSTTHTREQLREAGAHVLIDSLDELPSLRW